MCDPKCSLSAEITQLWGTEAQPHASPVLPLPFGLALRERRQEASLALQARQGPAAQQGLCSCSFANYTLTHTLLREHTEGKQRPSSEQAAVLIWRSISPQSCHFGSTRPGSCVPGAAWPQAQHREGGKTPKKIHGAKPKAPAPSHRGTGCCWQLCTAPTL